jgi:N6-adenosine-specific RNA methylase IME4
MNVLPRSNSYGVIYADPPWTFATYSRKGKGRSAEAHYDCMSLAEIKALPVADWAAGDCVLFMWTTDPLLPMAFEVIRSWGFTYKTVGFYWAKLNKSASKPVSVDRSFFTGLGFWTRANPEICLLATRGHPRRRSANVKKLIVSPRREPQVGRRRCRTAGRDAGSGQTLIFAPSAPGNLPLQGAPGEGVENRWQGVGARRRSLHFGRSLLRRTGPHFSGSRHVHVQRSRRAPRRHLLRSNPLHSLLQRRARRNHLDRPYRF